MKRSLSMKKTIVLSDTCTVISEADFHKEFDAFLPEGYYKMPDELYFVFWDVLSSHGIKIVDLERFEYAKAKRVTSFSKSFKKKLYWEVAKATYVRYMDDFYDIKGDEFYDDISAEYQALSFWEDVQAGLEKDEYADEEVRYLESYRTILSRISAVTRAQEACCV